MAKNGEIVKMVYLVLHKNIPIYIGSTKKSMSERMNCHRQDYYRGKKAALTEYLHENPEGDVRVKILYKGEDWAKEEERFIKEYKEKYTSMINRSTLASGNNSSVNRHLSGRKNGFTREEINRSVATRKKPGVMNWSKERRDRIRLSPRYNSLPIKNVETGKVYISASEAARDCNSSQQTVLRHCNGIKTRLKVKLVFLD
jgi:predicted GIY-YIG superfamily endonuclease